MSAANPSLAEEARYLHDRLFSQTLDPSVVARYEEAHRRLFPATHPSSAVERVVSRRLDPEAVEFALRRRGAGRDLTRKMQLLCYLVEVRSAYFPEFFNPGTGRLRAVTALLGATLRGMGKLLKGEYLVRRHGLL